MAALSAPPHGSISPAALTLYADLLQKVEAVQRQPGSISRKKVRGDTYLYAVEKHGQTRIQRYLGPAKDEQAIEESALIQAEAQHARSRRTQVSMLKRAGLPGPSLEVGRLLEAVARAGLFESGLVLIGTIAFSLYAPIVGAIPSAAFSMTQDADFAVASVTDTRGDADLTTVLRRADPTFQSAPSLHRTDLPRKFRASTGFEVEILTPVRNREDDGVVNIAGLGAGATPLHFMEFLIQDAIKAVALYNDGIKVTIPNPARYAIHKLIVAQERSIGVAKRDKDLAQAGALIAILHANDPFLLHDIWEEARARGPKWRTNIERSMKMLALTEEDLTP
ncbi:GSU2403 family nucleotidyltransferase fold protein [Labrys okinawensis]|uniref:GSU2403 family nucleotidyltransferase fold protein n=1 Tax=Labrys okinawensis TaxID=346911 RepID=UPI0039BC80B7